MDAGIVSNVGIMMGSDRWMDGLGDCSPSLGMVIGPVMEMAVSVHIREKKVMDTYYF